MSTRHTEGAPVSETEILKLRLEEEQREYTSRDHAAIRAEQRVADVLLGERQANPGDRVEAGNVADANRLRQEANHAYRSAELTREQFDRVTKGSPEITEQQAEATEGPNREQPREQYDRARAKYAEDNKSAIAAARPVWGPLSGDGMPGDDEQSAQFGVALEARKAANQSYLELFEAQDRWIRAQGTPHQSEGV